tara:strand:+ start:118 stop:945 length:828 start_codon:yes stop_codon:yes gene_type:complete
MPDYTCYEPGTTNQIPCSTEEMGQQYFEAVQSGDPSTVIDWYQAHLAHFMSETEGVDINDPAQFNQWMGTYGQYFAPLNVDMAEHSRISRESNLQRENLALEFMEKQPSKDLEIGKRGFANVGTGRISSNMWDEYLSSHQNVSTQSEMAYQDLYGDFGSDWLMMASSIAGTDAYTTPELTDVSGEGGFTWFNQFFDVEPAGDIIGLTGADVEGYWQDMGFENQLDFIDWYITWGDITEDDPDTSIYSESIEQCLTQCVTAMGEENYQQCVQACMD